MKYQINPTELLPNLPTNLNTYDPQQVFNKGVLEVLEKLFKGVYNDFKYLKVPTTAPSNPESGDIYFNLSTNTLYVYNGTGTPGWKGEVMT